MVGLKSATTAVATSAVRLAPSLYPHRLESDEVTDARESSVCAISSSSPGGPGLSHRLVAVLGRVIPSSPLTPSRPSSAIQTSPS